MIKRTLLLAMLPILAHAEELPAPVKAIEKQGITILKSFEAPGGMKGYLGKYQDMGVTIYLTPDGKHAISGYMYNEKGENLSNALIEKEIYARPDVKCGRKWKKRHGYSTVKKTRRWCCMSSPTLSAPIVSSFGNKLVRGSNPARYNYAHYWSA